MTRLDEAAAWLESNLGPLAEKFGVPGASAAVLADGDTASVATGVLNRATGVRATPDSLFQIGSVTKLWTTTLVMRLVDEGTVRLDAPVREYLPEFRVADPTVTQEVTVRHLLTHTSGFEGDLFRTTTRGDDAVLRFVQDVLPRIGQPVPLGTLYSYNNAGFVVLGRMIEVLTGQTWAEALLDRLVRPLGLTEVATDANEAILGRAAVGHLGGNDGQPPTPAKVWSLQHSNGPAGAMLAMSARAVLGLAKLYLNDGLAPDGTRLLSPDSITSMWQPAVQVPRSGTRARQWGLGWALDGWGGSVVGHNGQTVGQESYFRVAPRAGVAIALLTNGGSTTRLFHAVFTRLLAGLADVAVPALPVPSDPAPTVSDPRRYAGTYRIDACRIEVEARGDDLVLRSTTLGELGALQERAPAEHRLVPLDATEPDTFIAVQPELGVHPTWTFVGADEQGRARYVHNGRALPRID